MIQKKICSLFLSFLFLGCGTAAKKSEVTEAAERVPYSRPKQGFLWAFGMNRSAEPKTSNIHYLSMGTFQKKLGPFECSVQIEPEELDIEKKSIQQKAHVDCGEKRVNTICETNKHIEPFEIRIQKEGDSLKAMLGCDNGQNEMPPRTVFPGTTVLSSSALEPVAGQDVIRSTSIFPYKPEQNYSWIVFVSSNRKTLKTRTELTYEKPLSDWPGFPKSLKISADGRSASYEKIIKSENGNFILGDQYHVAKNDPGGYLRIRVFIEEQLAEEFWLRFL